jgi:hypothetical protein
MEKNVPLISVQGGGISKGEIIFPSRRFREKSEWVSLSRQVGVEKDGRLGRRELDQRPSGSVS